MGSRSLAGWKRASQQTAGLRCPVPRLPEGGFPGQAKECEGFGKFRVARGPDQSEGSAAMKLPQAAIARLRQVIEPREPLSVIVLYDEPLARDQALRVCANLVDHFEGALHINCRGWRFSQLRQLSLATTAARQAAAAAVTCLATVVDAPLPLTVRNWFALWRQYRAGGPTALVALVGTAEGTPGMASPLEEFLANIARQAGVDLIVGSFPLPRPVLATPPDLPPLARSLTPLMRRLVLANPPVPHWGIND